MSFVFVIPSSPLPLHFHIFRHVIGKGAVAIPVTGRKETADDTADMLFQTEFLRMVNTVTLHPQTEPADALQNNRVTIGQAVAHHIFQLRNGSNDITFLQRSVAGRFLCKVLQGHIILSDGSGKILAVVTTALNIIANKT